ncbi:MAG TPA: response regulator [Elusimicrobia bacterium]|nr:MAG: hypothetical protein A2016_03795 [Elusimicrobia bacterium GWF2_62_30]HBA60640.1 response regulator [Elusimicrobiota bacterium]
MKKILLVDDEDMVRNYVRRALSSRGWEVVEAVNGAAALEALRTTEFAAMICDLKMPDTRGEEVIKEAAATRPDMKIIVITGSVSDISNLIEPGIAAAGFLLKPFGIDEIRDLAEKVIGKVE